MKKLLISFITLSAFLCANNLQAAPAAKLVINKALATKLANLTTGLEVEKVLGPAAACVPVGKQSDEIAICQWKADPHSNSVINTLNITFEVNHIVLIRAINAQGIYYTVKDGKVIKED